MDIELYEFDYGDGDFLRLNNSNVTVTVAGSDWEGQTMARRGLDDDVSEKQSLVSARVAMAALGETIINYVGAGVGGDIILTIWKHTIGTSTRTKVFEGVVTEWGFKGLWATIKAQPKSSSAEESALRVILTAGCVLELYSDRCGVTKSTYRVYGTITDIDDDDATLVTINITESGVNVPADLTAPAAEGFFSYGHIKSGLESRMVNSFDADTNVVTLVAAFSGGVEEGDEVFMWAGCDKKMATCRDRFTNFEQFLGFPWVPYDDAVFIGKRAEMQGGGKK